MRAFKNAEEILSSYPLLLEQKKKTKRNQYEKLKMKTMKIKQLRGAMMVLLMMIGISGYGQIITEEVSVQMNDGKTLIQDAVDVEGELEVTKDATSITRRKLNHN